MIKKVQLNAWTRQLNWFPKMMYMQVWQPGSLAGTVYSAWGQFQKNNFQQGLEDLEKANVYMLNNYDVLCTLGSVRKQQTEQLIWIQIKQVLMSVSFLVFGFVAEVAIESFGFQIWRL
jgi:hypothetical protein